MIKKDGWEKKAIGDCFESIRNGASIKQNDNHGGIPITRIETISNSCFNRDKLGYANIDDSSKYTKYILNDGDILMSHINSLKYLGRAVLYKKLDNEVIIHGMNLLNLISDKNIVESQFITYYFNSVGFKSQISRISKKSVNQASFTTTDLKKITVLIPPLPIQHQIVAELDTLSNIITKKKQQLTELDNLAQATFYDMFGDPVSNEKGWEVKKLNTISKVGTGGTPSRKRESEFYNGTINWAKTTEVSGKYIYSTEESITELALNESNCKTYPIGTILLAMYGQGRTRGNVGFLKVVAATNQACAAIPPSLGINQVFLFELFKNSYQYLRGLARGGNQENLNLNIVGNINIILPPLSLQNKFVDKIESIEQQKSLINQSITETQQLFDYTMDKYFNEA